MVYVILLLASTAHASKPTVTATGVTGNSGNSATANGTFNPNGSETYCYFNWAIPPASASGLRVSGGDWHATAGSAPASWASRTAATIAFSRFPAGLARYSLFTR